MKALAQRTGAQYTRILGFGGYRPQRLVSNSEIVEAIDSSDEWIYTRTGIKTRRFARRDEDVVEMGIKAGRTAIASSWCTKTSA